MGDKIHTLGAIKHNFVFSFYNIISGSSLVWASVSAVYVCIPCVSRSASSCRLLLYIPRAVFVRGSGFNHLHKVDDPPR